MRHVCGLFLGGGAASIGLRWTSKENKTTNRIEAGNICFFCSETLSSYLLLRHLLSPGRSIVSSTLHFLCFISFTTTPLLLLIPHHHKVYNKTMSTALSVVNVMGRQGARRLMISGTTKSNMLLGPSQLGVISVGMKLPTLDKKRSSSALPRAKGRQEADATRMLSCELLRHWDQNRHGSKRFGGRQTACWSVRGESTHGIRHFQTTSINTPVPIQDERPMSISPRRHC